MKRTQATAALFGGRPFIGRTREVELLHTLARSGKAEFIAVYGRRRVGKTFLVRHAFDTCGALCFYVMGESKAPLRRQLALFQKSLETTFYGGERLPRVANWHDGFELLVAGVNRHRRLEPGRPISIFMDELPWLVTPRSTLLSALDHAWNTELQHIPEVKLVICGSAAGWMIRKVIHSKGGLHGRVTRTIPLRPFTLAECREFLRARNYPINDAGIIELFMTFGGIPFYLEQLEPRYSSSQNISRLCFGDGALNGEYALMLRSLFDHAEHHMKILRTLSAKHRGLTRSEIVAATGIPSGGRLDAWLEELERSDLIARMPDMSGQQKDERYRIIDEFILFHHTWIRRAPTGPSAAAYEGGYWDLMSARQSFRSWSGYAFENICIKHLAEINRALGIEKTMARICQWAYSPTGKAAHRKLSGTIDTAEIPEQGAQIDLLIDRDDGVISLCEVKYRREPFVIDRAYAEAIERKKSVFQSATKTRKSILFVLVCSQGIVANEYARRLVTNVVTAEDLFGRSPTKPTPSRGITTNDCRRTPHR